VAKDSGSPGRDSGGEKIYRFQPFDGVGQKYHSKVAAACFGELMMREVAVRMRRLLSFRYIQFFIGKISFFFQTD